jgi:hypothetical protein
MTRILVLWTLLIPAVHGQPAGDPDSDLEAEQQEQLPLQAEVEDLRSLLEKIKAKQEEEGDTGLHADAAEEGPDEEPEDIEFMGPDLEAEIEVDVIEDVIEVETIDESAMIELEDSEALLAGDPNN